MFWTYKDLNLYYEVVGNGLPALIIHGYGMDSNLMKPCLEPIMDSEKYRKIYIDLPGMGKTSAVEWMSNADILVDTLLKFIEDVIPSHKMLLIGESYGGYLGRALMYRLGERVAGGLFLCPVVIPEQEKRTLPSHVVLKRDDMEQYQNQPEFKDFTNFMVVQTSYTWNRYLNEVASGMQQGDKAFMSRFKKEGYKLSYEIDKLNSPYNVPTMFLLGKQDSIVGYEDALKLSNNFSRGSLLVVDKAGHNLQIEQEELFSCCVYKWLLDVKEFLY